MNEGKKTLAFWAAAAVMLGIGLFVAWPTPQADSNPIAGNQLFEKFTDPQSAASMKIVTFDEEKGTLATFEVRRDRESGLWNIPSRDGYPADAIEQMRAAANSLIGLKILDVQTSNAEDHDDLGVAEPKLEDLEVGDEGVGRLVTFKNESQETLASLIIGDQDKSDPEKRYVRIPGQDPVYVVKLDQSSLSTDFGDWIEKDLLKLSSIDIAEMQIDDYTASVTGRSLSLDRNYTATVELDGTNWNLISLKEYDDENPAAEPKLVEPGEDEQLNKTKLDAVKNALDDLKIADVVRKPDGMSANLRANKDFLNDRESVMSLQRNGFFPARASAEGDVEIVSANGELSVTLKEGVKYLMRFGDIAGVSEQDQSDEEEAGEESEDSDVGGGVNRYLLVTAMVDESKFPPPELREVPKSIEELKALLDPPKQETEETEAEETESSENDPGAESTDDGETESDEEPAANKAEMKEDAPEEPKAETDQEPSTGEEKAADAESDAESESSGEGEAAGSGAATGSGAALQEGTESDDETTDADPDDSEPADETESEPESEPGPPSDDKPEATGDTGEPDASTEQPKSELEGLSEEELQERLEAEQEKITKENQRKLDERKDKLEAARKKVQELNARFADWYYVIPEDTYAKLKIKRAEFLQAAEAVVDPAAGAPGAPGAGPQFQFPGAPGN